MELLDSKAAIQVMPRMLGRYELLGALARGGMATVYLARHRGEAGFQRLFAIKVMHAHLADDEEFVNMLLDEARIAARLHHPNVVPILDLGSQDGIHYVVMEYIEGCALSSLLRKFKDQRPPRLLISIMLDALAGLHAAHTLTDDDGNPMNLVHRDVSPQNVMVGIDGTARLTDFGIARAESRIMSTRPGQLKGKIAFMSPEQIRGADKVDCRSDLFSSAAMLWSALTARRLFLADSDAATLSNILHLKVPPASSIGCKPPEAFDALFDKGLARNPDERFQSAQDFEEALREAATAAGCLGSRREVAAWVSAGFGEELAERRKAVKAAAGGEGRAPMDSIPMSSGFRMMPGVGSLTPSSGNPAATPSNPSNPLITNPNLTPPSPGLIGTNPNLAPTALLTGETKPKRGMWVLGGAVGALALIAAVAVGVMMMKESEPAAQAMPATTEAAVVTPSSTPPVPEPVAAVAPTTGEPAPAASSEATDEKETKRSGARRWAAAGTFKGANPEPVAKPAPEVTTPPPAPPPEPAKTTKKPAIWDKDSPLPPQ